MERIKFKDGVIKSGEYEGCRCILMINDDKLTLNIFSNEKHSAMGFDNVEQMNKSIQIDWDDINKEKELAYEVVEWWSKNFPNLDFSEKILKTISDWDDEDEISPYILFGVSGAVQSCYDDKIEDRKELKKFLDGYAKFYEEFFDKYQHGKTNDLEDYSATEIFEWLDEKQSSLVFDLLQPGRLKEYCCAYFGF